MATNRYATEFGRALAAELDKVSDTQSALATRIGLSATYLSAVVTGRRKPHPGLVKAIVDDLDLTKPSATALHTAAARDTGYEVGDG